MGEDNKRPGELFNGSLRLESQPHQRSATASPRQHHRDNPDALEKLLSIGLQSQRPVLRHPGRGPWYGEAVVAPAFDDARGRPDALARESPRLDRTAAVRRRLAGR